MLFHIYGYYDSNLISIMQAFSPSHRGCAKRSAPGQAGGFRAFRACVRWVHSGVGIPLARLVEGRTLHLYRGSGASLARDLAADSLVRQLTRRFEERLLYAPTEGEVRSWTNSLPAVS